MKEAPGRHSDPSPRPPRRWGPARVYLLVLLSAFALYALTAQRGPAWQDSGVHQLRTLQGEYLNERGLALAHPLLIAMGQPLKLVGTEHLPFLLNLLSGLGMAIAVANVFLIGVGLTGRYAGALLASTMLAVSHTPWWLATITETYPWVAAGLTTELLLLGTLLSRPRIGILAGLAVVNGLGLSMHNFALLALPVYVLTALWLVIHRRLSWTALPAAAGAWLAGAGLFLGLAIHQGMETGDWAGTINSALFGSSWEKDVLAVGGRALGRAALYALLNWPWLGLAPVAVGWWLMPRRAGRALAVPLGAVAAIHILFAIRYPVVDQFMFMLPTYCLLAIGATVGADRLLHARRPWGRVWTIALLVSLALTPVLYGIAPRIVHSTGRSIGLKSELPYRDGVRYYLTPWKQNENSAGRFASEALRDCPENAGLWPYSMAYPALKLTQKTKHVRTDIRLLRGDVAGRIEADPVGDVAILLKEGKLMVAPASESLLPPDVRESYSLIPRGMVAQLAPRSQPGPIDEDN